MCRTTKVYFVILEFPNKPFHNQLGFQEQASRWSPMPRICLGEIYSFRLVFIISNSLGSLFTTPVPHCCPSWGSCPHGNTYILIFSTENSHCNSQVIRSCHGQTLTLYNEGLGRLNHFILFSFQISSNSFLGAQEAFYMLVTFFNKLCYFSHRKLGKIGKMVFFQCTFNLFFGFCF